VPRERSLDEFVDPDGKASGASGASDGPEGAVESGASDRPGDPDDADPDPDLDLEGDRSATPTHDWSPGGAACADCGAEVEERWGGEAGLVCRDCKEW